MRKIAAPYIFPVSSKPIKNGILHVSDNGEILDIINNSGRLSEEQNLEYYNGIIVPGFINAHCHIELSYMKGLLESKGNGLPFFLKNLSQKRVAVPANIAEIITRAENEMIAEGIVAVGDVSNDAFSFDVKRKGSIMFTRLLKRTK
jgi:cytosine/adenosine deaminase-related metal-dependent hydrolase